MRIRNATVGGQGVQRGRGREWCVPSGGGGSGDVLAKVTAGNAVCVRRSKVACRVAELRCSFSFPLDARVSLVRSLLSPSSFSPVSVQRSSACWLSCSLHREPQRRRLQECTKCSALTGARPVPLLPLVYFGRARARTRVSPVPWRVLLLHPFSPPFSSSLLLPLLPGTVDSSLCVQQREETRGFATLLLRLVVYPLSPRRFSGTVRRSHRRPSSTFHPHAPPHPFLSLLHPRANVHPFAPCVWTVSLRSPRTRTFSLDSIWRNSWYALPCHQGDQNSAFSLLNVPFFFILSSLFLSYLV